MDLTLNPLHLPDGAVLLLAVNLASVPQLTSLRSLIAGYPDILHFTVVLEILLKVLPETTSPEEYVPVVYRLYHRENEPFDPSRISASALTDVSSLPPQNIRRRLNAFDLSVPPKSSGDPAGDEKVLIQWFFDRARRVEESTGMIDLARRLVLCDTTNFLQSPPFPPLAVKAWGKGIVQVLETFIFDNDDEDELQLLPFENLEPDSAVRLLLSRTTPETISRNIRNLIIPFVEYIHSQQSSNSIWATVWDWLSDRAIAGELNFIAQLSSDWVETDESVLQGFVRTCLQACYLCDRSSATIRADLRRIHDNMLRLWQFPGQHSDDEILLGHPETDVLASQLRDSSPLTVLSASSLKLLDQMVVSADIIAAACVTPELSLRELIIVRGGSEENQKQLADRLLCSDQNWSKRTDEQWRKLRLSLKWLQGQSRILGKLSEELLDTMILTSLLDATAFGLAREIFVQSKVLSSEILERTVLRAFYCFYDNATNGNRTRGDMKNAFQTLHVLDDPNATPSTSHAVKLVSATHALSNYSLFISPGVTITPAQIRLNKDPALLVCKVIENNSQVYREGDRMIKILNDLIDGTQLFDQTPGNRNMETNRMQARVFTAIVNAALAENDFNTAYDTCINKLSPLTLANPDDTAITNTVWSAFYRTGIYTDRRPSTRASVRTSLPSNSFLDFQKMEVLSRAMLACPKEEIEGILKHWTALENKTLFPNVEVPPPITASTQAPQEHRSLLATAAQVGRSVARTASPLIPGAGGPDLSLGQTRERASAEFISGNSNSRFGVTDTVRSGLTQGIGWLIGATPQQEQNHTSGDYK